MHHIQSNQIKFIINIIYRFIDQQKAKNRDDYEYLFNHPFFEVS